MKSITLALLLLSSGVVHAACQSGQMTTLTTAAEFQRREANGNILKITLGAGAEVHIISTTTAGMELMATAQFQGQQLSVLSDIDNETAAKALSCSK